MPLCASPAAFRPDAEKPGLLETDLQSQRDPSALSRQCSRAGGGRGGFENHGSKSDADYAGNAACRKVVLGVLKLRP